MSGADETGGAVVAFAMGGVADVAGVATGVVGTNR
jgi:hypothetical protein